VTDYAFVVKLIPRFDAADAAKDLRYGTYLGGSSVDWAHSIVRVADQAAAVVGFTASDGSAGSGGWAFPTGGASGSSFDSTHNGGNDDGFVTYLNWSPSPPPVGHPIASQLRYSSFLGTSAGDKCFACDVDGFTIYVGGATLGAGFPTSSNTFDASLNGSSDGFATSFTLPTNWP
jgi:hypothetical protein